MPGLCGAPNPSQVDPESQPGCLATKAPGLPIPAWLGSIPSLVSTRQTRPSAQPCGAGPRVPNRDGQAVGGHARGGRSSPAPAGAHATIDFGAEDDPSGPHYETVPELCHRFSFHLGVTAYLGRDRSVRPERYLFGCCCCGCLFVEERRRPDSFPLGSMQRQLCHTGNGPFEKG